MSTAKIYMHQMANPPADFTYDLEVTSTPTQSFLEAKIAKKLDGITDKGKKPDKVVGKPTLTFKIDSPKIRYIVGVRVVSVNKNILTQILEYRLCLMTYNYNAIKP